MTIRHAALALLLAATPALSHAQEDAAAVSEKDLRAFGDTVLSMSDQDYRDAVAADADLAALPYAKRERPEAARATYRRLALLRRSRAAAKPDPELIANADFAGFVRRVENYINAEPRRVPRFTAVAAVRGGRKLSTTDDKEVARLLASVDGGALADEQAADAYDKVAEIVGRKVSLTAKEIYEKDAKSVVLIIAGRPSGQGELGTGSVIDASGRVLTNAHVVVDDRTGQPYPTIHLYLKPQKVTGDPKADMTDPIDAKVTRYDRGLDLALVEPARAPGVPPLALGDDSAVEPGDPVVAIGHPEQGGLWTLTQGVVSAFVANLGGVSGKSAFQTDASINRGNSGGPLIARDGSLIGVNTSMARKAADGLTITSVNFSVRSSVARAWLGGEAPSASVAAVTAAPAAPIAPAAPAELPPAPKTKPVVLTPAKPYRIDDVIAADIKELEDQGEEMHQEILRRAAARPKAP